VSNIPFNTIASVLATSGVQRQNAAVQAKRTQDDQRVQQVFKVQTDRRAEEVADVGDTVIDSIGDEPDKHNQQRKSAKHKPEDEDAPREVTDITQLSAEAANAPATNVPKAPPAPRPTLDISA
jgi:hypothetical protein